MFKSCNRPRKGNPMTNNDKAIDKGNDVVVVEAAPLDARSKMLASAARIVEQSVEAESAIGETAKQWGFNLFVAVYQDNANMDSLIGDSKVASGWQHLSSSEAGRKAKGRMEVYFSNARLVAERWSQLSDEQREQVLAGLSSIHYLAGQFRKADADAKKAAKKAAELEAAKVAASESGTDAATVEAAPPSLESMVLALIDAYQVASVEEREAAYPAFALLVEQVNGDAEVVEQAEVEQAEAA